MHCWLPWLPFCQKNRDCLVTKMFIVIFKKEKVLSPSNTLLLSCIYCKMRKFTWDKVPWLTHPNNFAHFYFHYSMAVLFHIITIVNISEAFNFHGFASSKEIAKINCKWNVLVLQWTEPPKYQYSKIEGSSSYFVYGLTTKAKRKIIIILFAMVIAQYALYLSSQTWSDII